MDTPKYHASLKGLTWVAGLKKANPLLTSLAVVSPWRFPGFLRQDPWIRRSRESVFFTGGIACFWPYAFSDWDYWAQRLMLLIGSARREIIFLVIASEKGPLRIAFSGHIPAHKPICSSPRSQWAIECSKLRRSRLDEAAWRQKLHSLLYFHI